MRNSWVFWITLVSSCAAATGQVATTSGVTADVGGVTKLHALRSPTRLAVEPGGTMLVSDYHARCIARYNPAHDKVIDVIPVGGKPTGVATLDGRIYVGNEATDGIEIYDADGTLIGYLGGTDQFVVDPTDMAVDAAINALFVVDGSDKQIKIFNLAGDGTLVGTIAGPGLAEHLLQHPTGVALDTAAQEVFVADYGEIEEGAEPRVLIFGYDGSFRGSISGDGGAQGYHFSKPQGLAIGESGHVFVVDGWLGRVVVMDRGMGEPVATLGQFGSGQTDLRLPLDAVITGPNDDLFVTSNLTRRVVKFPAGGRQ